MAVGKLYNTLFLQYCFNEHVPPTKETYLALAAKLWGKRQCRRRLHRYVRRLQTRGGRSSRGNSSGRSAAAEDVDYIADVTSATVAGTSANAASAAAATSTIVSNHRC